MCVHFCRQVIDAQWKQHTSLAALAGTAVKVGQPHNSISKVKNSRLLVIIYRASNLG